MRSVNYIVLMMAVLCLVACNNEPSGVSHDIPMITFKADPSLLETAESIKALGISINPPLGCIEMPDDFFKMNQNIIETSIGLDTTKEDYQIVAAYMDTVNYISCMITTYTWGLPEGFGPKEYHFKTTKMLLANWEETNEACFRVKKDIVVREFSFSNTQVQHQKYFVVIEGKPLFSVDYLMSRDQYRHKEDMINASIASVSLL